jgi:hypothetical protein
MGLCPVQAGGENDTLAELYAVADAKTPVGAPGTVTTIPAKPMDFRLPAALVIIVGILYLF